MDKEIKLKNLHEKWIKECKCELKKTAKVLKEISAGGGSALG